mmetsp:Transcript_113072/g.217758  ORF Transcript_113072/g.217758 Transcript_113072/m.217758 type:complete len:268 (-) Transcript_113072:180-983(-)
MTVCSPGKRLASSLKSLCLAILKARNLEPFDHASTPASSSPDEIVLFEHVAPRHLLLNLIAEIATEGERVLQRLVFEFISRSVCAAVVFLGCAADFLGCGVEVINLAWCVLEADCHEGGELLHIILLLWTWPKIGTCHSNDLAALHRPTMGKDAVHTRNRGIADGITNCLAPDALHRSYTLDSIHSTALSVPVDAEGTETKLDCLFCAYVLPFPIPTAMSISLQLVKDLLCLPCAARTLTREIRSNKFEVFMVGHSVLGGVVCRQIC